VDGGRAGRGGEGRGRRVGVGTEEAAAERGGDGAG
jgi:hypothetical protein